MTKKIEETNSIAIIGMTGRFPEAENISQFWENLKNGVESISHVPDEKNPSMIHADGILENIDKFDADFFDYSPREAEIIDPQHRIFLEETWSLLEQTGYTSGKYNGIISIFAGSNMSGYLVRNLYSNPGLVEKLGTFKTMLANGQDFVSTRASYKMNLTGASVNINTLCSSSLVAVHYGCNNLLDYSSDLVIAGGVNIQVSRSEALFYQEGGIGASDGHCRAFDAKANGTVSGSGIALIALKRLEDALEEGDTIYAVIKGSAVNNDGGNKNSFTAPNADGQAQCIAEAIEMADISPETISYIETHGTGTNLGDPIEIAGLTKAFTAYTDKKQFCAIGSVKTNIGHLVTAGGAAGLIKTVLAMKNKKLPASLNFDEPNPRINFKDTPFYVNTNLKDWVSDKPLRAGISSFGIGGTNAHVIIEEAPAQRKSSGTREYQVMCLSAKIQPALDKLNDNLLSYIKNNEINSADAAYTMNTGRKDFNFRKVFVFKDNKDLTDENLSLSYTGNHNQDNKTGLFIFPGKKQFYNNMCRNLYDSEIDFKELFDYCNKIVIKESGIDLKSVIFSEIENNKYSELAIIVLEYALGKLLETWGIFPGQMTGMGIGEFTAAVFAGIISIEDVIKIFSSENENRKNTLESIELNKPSVKIVSSVTGVWLTEEEAVSKEHWLKVIESININENSLKFFIENSNGIFIEIGTGDGIKHLVNNDSDRIFLKILRKENDKISDEKELISFIGRYWVEGGSIDWNGFYKHEERNKIPLPAYPFERKSYWIKPGSRDAKYNENENLIDKLENKPRPSISTEYKEPVTETEKILTETWQDQLGITPIGINDDFFDLGGHSLIAAALAKEINTKFNTNIKLTEFFDKNTISILANYIDELKEDNKEENEDKNDIDELFISENNKPAKNRILIKEDLVIAPAVYKTSGDEKHSRKLEAARIRELPIAIQRDITTYLDLCLPLCVIRSNNFLTPWFYSNFIHIFTYENNEGYLQLNYMENSECIKQLGDYKKFGFEWLNDDEDIVDKLIRTIDKRKYIDIHLDEFYLKNKISYQNTHFVHNSMIYGYNMDNEEFLAVGFNNDYVITKVRFAFSETRESFASAKDCYMETAPWAKYRAIQLFDLYYSINPYPFSIKKFLHELEQFIYSVKDEIRLYSFWYSDIKTQYGISVYDRVVKKFQDAINGKIGIDYRSIHLLCEHQKGLYDRLLYLETVMLTDLNLKERLLPLYNIHMEFNKMRLKYMNLMRVHSTMHVVDVDFFKEMIEKIINAKSVIFDLLEPLYKELSDLYNVQTKNKNKQQIRYAI